MIGALLLGAASIGLIALAIYLGSRVLSWQRDDAYQRGWRDAMRKIWCDGEEPWL